MARPKTKRLLCTIAFWLVVSTYPSSAFANPLKTAGKKIWHGIKATAEVTLVVAGTIAVCSLTSICR